MLKHAFKVTYFACFILCPNLVKIRAEDYSVRGGAMQIPVIKLGPIESTNTPTLIALREGQLLKGLVQSKDGSNLVLNLSGVKLIVQTDLEVSAGQSLWLEAVEVKPEKIILKLLDGVSTEINLPNKIPNTIYAKLDITPSPVTDKVIEVLMSLSLPISKELVEEITGRIIIQLSNEDVEILTHTNDNFKILTRTNDDMKVLTPTNDDVKVLTRTNDDVEVLTHTIIQLKSRKLPLNEENIQLLKKVFAGEAEPEEVVYALKLLNEVRRDQPNLPSLYYVWWQNELQQGEIYLWQEQKGKRRTEEMHNALVLHFYTQNLGELWIKLINLSSKLSLTLTTENPKAIALFREHLSKLEAMLKVAGYDLGAISYKLDRVESVFNCLQNEAKSKYKGIDLKV